MIFASFEFLFLFLPVFFALYALTPARLRNGTLLVLSWAFYAWWRVDFLLLLIGVTGFTYALARVMAASGPRAARGLLVLGLAGNLGVLGYFKYANFGVGLFNQAATGAGFGGVAWSAIVLPAGLSFYVLQSVSYLIDVARGTIPVSRSLVNYAAYKAMFSQLIAGPIVRYAQIAGDLRHRTLTLEQFGLGARRFMTGFCMKVIVADTLSPLVDAIFRLDAPTLADAWLGAAAYTLQLYFDFAGYSAMAIGLALMIGFHFPENFADPYLAGSIQAFWARWHMTLSRFLRDYLYIPLGGNRGGAARTLANLMLTMLIGGLWHGANWTFVVWGGWHGLLLALHRLVRPGLPWIAGHALTLLGVMLGWVIFRADDWDGALRMYRGMLGLQGAGVSDALAWQLTPDRLWMVAIGAAVVYAPLLRVPAAAAALPPARGLVLAGPLCGFLVAMVLLYSRAAVPFLYFQF